MLTTWQKVTNKNILSRGIIVVRKLCYSEGMSLTSFGNLTVQSSLKVRSMGGAISTPFALDSNQEEPTWIRAHIHIQTCNLLSDI